MKHTVNERNMIKFLLLNQNNAVTKPTSLNVLSFGFVTFIRTRTVEQVVEGWGRFNANNCLCILTSNFKHVIEVEINVCVDGCGML